MQPCRNSKTPRPRRPPWPNTKLAISVRDHYGKSTGAWLLCGESKFTFSVCTSSFSSFSFSSSPCSLWTNWLCVSSSVWLAGRGFNIPTLKYTLKQLFLCIAAAWLHWPPLLAFLELERKVAGAHCWGEFAAWTLRSAAPSLSQKY